MIVICNWKAKLTLQESLELFAAYEQSGVFKLVTDQEWQLVIAPATIALPGLIDINDYQSVEIIAQDVATSNSGTGATTVRQLSDLGCTGSIVGHSETRANLRLDNGDISTKLRNLTSAGLQGILCVGENMEQRQAGSTNSILADQLDALGGDTPTVVAYEPIWAISTNQNSQTADPQSVAETIDFIGTKTDTEIIYGGSVTEKNIAAYISIPKVSGVIIGGMSLDADRLYSALSKLS